MKLFNISALLAVVVCCQAQDQARHIPTEGSAARNYVSEHALSERIFPLLEALSRDAVASRVLAADAELQAMTRDRWATIASSGDRCVKDHVCVCETLVFDEGQIAKTSTTLQRLYAAELQVRSFVRARLLPVETYAFSTDAEAEDLLVIGWQHAARSMNAVIRTYCEGKAPRYPDIDSMSYDPASNTYTRLVGVMLSGLSFREDAVDPHTPQEMLFFQPSLRFALRLLQANGRDEAARFAGLDAGQNAAALERLKHVRWSRYRYSAIVLLGAGSELANVNLSPWGKERIRLGVAAYRAGAAPFLFVSGGFAHPSKTPFCEAFEMKRYLMEVYGVPGSAILIDPYARHTTTNLRNVSRALLLQAFPADGAMLVVSDALQIGYVASKTFSQRNQQELGYQPVILGKQVSPTSIEARPSRRSLLVDAADPLDP